MDIIIRMLIVFIFCQIFLSGSHYMLGHYFSFENTEIQRKISHFIMVIVLTLLIICCNAWYESVIILFLISIIELILLNKNISKEKHRDFQRKKNEFNLSIYIMFIMFFLVMIVCCGFFNDKFLALTSLYAWALGDAFAAIIGKKYGRKKIKWKYINKTYIGTFTMFIVTLATLLILFIIKGTTNITYLTIVFITTSFVSTIVELLSPPVFDTLTCPIASMIILICLKFSLGGF